ncbi:MAG: ankyrin repeat domain-containing protein [Pyrinomonadaceae bacterium]
MKSVKFTILLLVAAVFHASALGQNSKQELNDQLWEAARKGDAAAVAALLDKGADVNAKFRYGTTALFKAAERGNTEVVNVLLARGADVQVKDTFYGATAMTWALDHNHDEIVRALLEKSPQSTDEVLLNGARQNKVGLVRIALARSAATPAALTSALVAAMNGDNKNDEIADLLKKAGALPPPEIDAATLQSYAGKYKSDQGREIDITFKDGNLFAVFGGQPIYAIRPGANGDISLKDGKESNEFITWSKQRGGPYMPTPVVYGEYLYTLSNQGVLTAYNAKTGERIYQERLGGKGGAFTASPVASDGKIYLSSEDGDVFVVKAGPKYELLATNPVGEVMMATPAINRGLLIVRGVNHLFAFGESVAPTKTAKK